MYRVHGRSALGCGVGALVASVTAAPTCWGAIIPPGVHARAEALEWISPWMGIGQQDIDAGVVIGPSVVAHATAGMAASGKTDAIAFADYGFLVNTGTTVGSYTVPSGRAMYAQAITDTSFRDDQVVVLSDSVAPGTPGVLQAEYELDRIVDFDISSIAGFAGDAVVVGGFSIDVVIGSYAVNYTGTWTYDAVTGILVDPGLPNGLVQALVPFQYGVPFTIGAAVEMKLTVYAEGPTTIQADTQLSLGPSFVWQGITDGLPDDATVSSNVVPDWRKPYGIPAPGAGAALVLMAGGIASRRNRR
jgi:hypothetical protein